MKLYQPILCLLFFTGFINLVFSQSSRTTIYYNAKIFTANSAQPYAEAVAIRGKKILAVGNFKEVLAAAGTEAETKNLQGRCLLPGFIDSHSHSIDGGESLLRPNVSDSSYTPEDLLSFVNNIRTTKEGMMGNIIVIDGLNISTWSYIDRLNKLFSDGKYTSQPVLLRGSDGHTAWANKALCTTAGLDKDYITSLSPDKKKYFGYNSNNEPNGFVADSGSAKIDAVLPASNTDYKKAAQKAIEYNNALGITAWLDPAAGNTSGKTFHILDAYRYLAESNQLSAHVAATIVANANGDIQRQIGTVKGLQKKYAGNADFTILGFKIFADGVIEYPTQTAALSKLYTNSSSSGVLMYHPAKFKSFVTAADKAKLLVHVHAIGDLAVTETLNGFEAMRKSNGNSGIPHTITHIQVAQPSDFDRFKQLNILASLQLLWALGDVTTIDIVKPYIDPELYRYQYPARSLLQAGATICGASDWPVSTANPFEAIYEAETRKGKMGVLDSTQCMPRLEMLYAYTIHAAKALMMEDKIGSIKAGKSADLILLDRDVLTTNAESFKTTKVIWTMFEGKLVYQANKE